MTARIRKASDHWIDIEAIDDRRLAERIGSDRIDVLIDLAGHTGRNRLRTFALKPAPLQISWIGYFSTTGLEAIDALFSDRWEVPEGAERWFAERVVRMDAGRFAYMPPDFAPEVTGPPAERSGRITFGSFNQLAKLNDQVVSAWSAVVNAVPRSRLKLKANGLGDRAVARTLRDRFRQAGLAADRLALEGPSTHAELLQAYGEIDIALDPFPYSGCITTLEALWMGVPVVALIGSAAVSRQSAAILERIGLGRLAAATASDYREAAQRLASEAAERRALRFGLRERLRGSSLLDGRAVAGSAEAAIRSLWRTWCGRDG
jgi:predicted O-linked N-acetylglucosamine transferase (SPINDLY family)